MDAAVAICASLKQRRDEDKEFEELLNTWGVTVYFDMLDSLRGLLVSKVFRLTESSIASAYRDREQVSRCRCSRKPSRHCKRMSYGAFGELMFPTVLEH